MKIGQRYRTSHVTRTPFSRSKGQRSRSPGRFTHRGVNASGSCSGDRGNVLIGEPTATLRSAGAVGSAARGASAPTERGEGILWRSPAYSLFIHAHCWLFRSDDCFRLAQSQRSLSFARGNMNVSVNVSCVTSRLVTCDFVPTWACLRRRRRLCCR